MLVQIYSVYDQQAENYGSPFTAVNVNIAKRNIIDAARDSVLGIHPQDFELWEVAQMDTITGEVIPTNKRIVRVRDLLNEYRKTAEQNIEDIKKSLEENKEEE